MEKRQTGFAALSPERRREIAALGGRKAQQKGTGHRFTSEEAREAGKLGGIKISSDREYMSIIGARGGSRLGVGKTQAPPVAQEVQEIAPENQPAITPFESPMPQTGCVGSEDGPCFGD